MQVVKAVAIQALPIVIGPADEALMFLDYITRSGQLRLLGLALMNLLKTLRDAREMHLSHRLGPATSAVGADHALDLRHGDLDAGPANRLGGHHLLNRTNQPRCGHQQDS